MGLGLWLGLGSLNSIMCVFTSTEKCSWPSAGRSGNGATTSPTTTAKAFVSPRCTIADAEEVMRPALPV